MAELEEEPRDSEKLLAEYGCELELEAGVDGQALVSLVKARRRALKGQESRQDLAWGCLRSDAAIQL